MHGPSKRSNASTSKTEKQQNNNNSNNLFETSDKFIRMNGLKFCEEKNLQI